MRKARFIAPWHQPDLVAGLEGGDLSVEELGVLKGKPAIYHCMSRVVDGRQVFGDAEREQFVRYMRAYERFCGVRVLAFCVMSNHFHVLLEVPAAPEERGADWSDARLLEHLSGLYSNAQVGKLRWQLEQYREQGNEAGAAALRARYFSRMWDLSQFMKTLKQRFTTWFNRQHERRGTLWEARFKSILVEDGHAARTMAAYIDLNPARAGMVDDPKDYRWCSYAEAVAGGNRARQGLQRVMFEAGVATMAAEVVAEELLSWRQASYHYRHVLHLALNRSSGSVDAAGTSRLSEGAALMCRIRHLTDGMVLGTPPFVEGIFRCCRGLFGEKRQTGARKLRGIDTPLRTMRDLGPAADPLPASVGRESCAAEEEDIVPVHGNPFWIPESPAR